MGADPSGDQMFAKKKLGSVQKQKEDFILAIERNRQREKGR